MSQMERNATDLGRWGKQEENDWSRRRPHEITRSGSERTVITPDYCVNIPVMGPPDPGACVPPRGSSYWGGRSHHQATSAS